MTSTNIDYEQRAERMINRWAGVRAPPRSDQDRQVNEIFTDRETQNGTKNEEYITGNVFSVILLY